MNFIDLSSTVGLIAVTALSLDALIGILTWSKVKFRLAGKGLFLWHKWTGYVAATCVLGHIVLIPFDPKAGITWKMIALPFLARRANDQGVMMTVGAVGLWLLAIIVTSSYLKLKIGHKLWRKLHYLSYIALPIILVHGLWMDPKLKNRPVDYLDGEKVLVEGLAFILLSLIVYRLRVTKKKTA